MIHEVLIGINPLYGEMGGYLAVALLAVYLLTKTIYRLFFHPLARFPGPKLAAATSCYEFYFSVVKNGIFPWKIKELHDKFGPVVRITPNELHFSDPDFYNEIYSGHKSPRDKYAPFYCFTGATQSAFETHDSRLHNSRRQPLMSAFSKKSITEIEPLILEKVNVLVQRFRQAGDQDKILVLDAAFAAMTADVISEYSYGYSLGYLDDDNFQNDIRESLMASLSLFHVVRFFPAIMRLAKIMPVPLVRRLNPNLCKVLDLRRLIRTMTVEELDKMQGGRQSQATLVQRLNDPSIPQSERSLERLCDEGFVFLNAGVTAGKTLAFIVFQILNNGNEIYEKLFEELRQAFPDVGDMDRVTEKDLVALPYLRGVIYEGLRLSIGPLSRLPRLAPTSPPLLFHGTVIPPGTGISESNYFLHMNEQLFPHPMQFRPERWAEAEQSGQRLQNYIVTFSKGTRHCLGMNLAYVELYMLVAVLVRRFYLELYQTTEEDVEVFRDKLFGYPRNQSQGVRIRVTGCRG